MEKKSIEVGFYDSGTGKHQSNTVYSRKGCLPTLTTLDGGTIQMKVLKKYKPKTTKEVIVLGGISQRERKNRDSMRVISGHGTIYTLAAHIYKDPVLVLKRWKNDLT